MIQATKTLAIAAALSIAFWTPAAKSEFLIESLDNDFPSEVEAAAEEDKQLVIMFHQTGCPYCDKMRSRVLPDPKVDAYYSKNFVMVESNIRGDLNVVSPDGEEMLEKELARKMRVRATPVFVFFDKKGKDVLRLTGFLDAERFNKAGRFVVDEVYKTKTSFYRYLLQ